MNKKISVILLILCLSSCYSYNYEREDKPDSFTYKITDHSFFWGLEESDSKDECYNAKTKKVESKNGFLNYFVRLYTLGIYWPRTFEVECQK